MDAKPILLLGAGRMGGALIRGWLDAGAFAASDLIVRDPFASGEALHAGSINPTDDALASAKVVLLSVKPQIWRDAFSAIVPHLAADAVIVSIAAGVRLADIQTAAEERRVARVMPTTSVAIGKGVASIFAPNSDARTTAHQLFDPVAATVVLAEEALMDAATAVSGSAPAYLYAFIEALEAAGAGAGLEPEAARTLARKTILSAAALMDVAGEDPAELRRQVTSPGGTTAAALEVLMGDNGFPSLMEKAVGAAVRRSRELG